MKDRLKALSLTLIAIQNNESDGIFEVIQSDVAKSIVNSELNRLVIESEAVDCVCETCCAFSEIARARTGE